MIQPDQVLAKDVQIITADWFIPMNKKPSECHANDKHLWLENAGIAICNEDILAVGTSAQLQEKFPQATKQHFSKQVLLPGFINSHCHAAMNLLRGFSDDLPLKQWLEDAIWPAEAKFVDNEFITQGTEHAIAELLLSGTTCFQDMYFIADQAANVVQKSGIKASIGLVIMDFKTSWTADAQDCINKGLDVYDQFKHSHTVNFNLAPHAPYTVCKQTLEHINVLSNQLNLPVQIHMHETAFEVESFIKEHGIRPLSMMKDIGLISPLLNAVHMTQLNQGEIEWLAEYGSHVIHCPQSNMKLASGVCPTKQLIDAGVNLAIGTDGAASNNDLDMIDEMKSATLLSKLDYQDPTSMSAYQALYCATVGGAKALGLFNQTGSLEANKKADFITIDLNRLETMPVYNPISQIVYAASRDQVSNVWVNGKCLVKDRQLQTLNQDLIFQHIAKWQEKISQQ